MQIKTPYRVLAIDDDPGIHDVYCSIFDQDNNTELLDELSSLKEIASFGEKRESRRVEKGQRFILDFAYSGEEGLQRVEASLLDAAPYAVVFLDMRMPPGWDGLKTAEMIREIDPAIRIILITAYMDYELEDIQQRIGIDFVFLSKPVNRNELIQLTTLFASQWEQAHRLVQEHNFNLKFNQSIPWPEQPLEEGGAASTVEEEGQPISESTSQQVPERAGFVIRILLVDDSPAILSLYGNLLRRSTQHRIATAGSSAEALEVAAEFAPDLTIIGHSFSNQQGNQLAQQLLARTPTGESLVVFLADKSDVEEFAFMSGAIEVLFKDDPTEIFLQRITSLEGYICRQKQLRASIELEAQQYLSAAEGAWRASRAKDEFLASVSHELRTPLTVIIGNSETLADSELTTEQRSLLRSVEVSARGQLALINDILDMSKIEAGKFSIDNAPFSLDALVEEIRYIFTSRAQDADLEFTIEQQDHPQYQMMGDGRRIGQILINLLGNALKFTREGGIALTIWIDDQLHFSVKDSGIGIAEDAMALLFEPYQQADETISQRFGGTGLGLNISWTLAELMGGSIEVESQEGVGTRFQLNLPCTLSELAVDDEATNQRGAMIYSSFSGKVLVAEDSPEIQMVVRRMLESMGIEVTLAANGSEAVGIALSTPQSLILMDMQMPVVDGVEATRMLRGLGCDTPIVALTANVMQKHRDQFTEAGCSGFLSKPIDRRALLDVLKQYLREDTSLVKAANESATAEHEDIIDEELMVLFRERTMALLDELKQNRALEDWRAVRAAAHTVKGSGTTFGHPELTESAKEVCDAIDQGRQDSVGQLLDELVALMESAIDS